MSPRGLARRGPVPSVYTVYAEGVLYAEGQRGYAEGGLRRGATPTAALGVAYADGKGAIRRGQAAVGVVVDSRSEPSRSMSVTRSLSQFI